MTKLIGVIFRIRLHKCLYSRVHLAPATDEPQFPSDNAAGFRYQARGRASRVGRLVLGLDLAPKGNVDTDYGRSFTLRLRPGPSGLGPVP